MKVIVLTSSLYGTAAHHLPVLLGARDLTVSMVVYNEGTIRTKNSSWKRKLKKVARIGILGALNGIRMRKWFNRDMEKYVRLENTETICRRAGIPFFRTPAINHPRTRELFQQAGADLGISLGNGYIGKKLFGIPRYGMINIHHEILPQYQNAQSIIWQLYNGSATTGYTIHLIDQKIDTGAILYQEPVPISFRPTLADTIAHTSAKLLEASGRGLLAVLQQFEHYLQHARPQGPGTSYTTPTIRQYLRIHKNFRKLQQSIHTEQRLQQQTAGV